MDVHLARDDLNLSLLPPEILHRIASYLPCSTILSLCFSCRQLYALCYDRLVFRRCAKNALYEDRYTHFPTLSYPSLYEWDVESLASATTTEVDSEDSWCSAPDEQPTSDEEWDFHNWGPGRLELRLAPHFEWLATWPNADVFNDISAGEGARIAWAIEKSQRLFNVELELQPWDRSPQWQEGGWIKWLPHLLALGHKSCLELKPWSFQRLLFEPDADWEDPDFSNGKPWRNQSASEYVCIGFCIVLLILVLAEGNPGLNDIHAVHDLLEDFCLPRPNACYIGEQLDWLLMEAGDIREFDLKDRYSVILRTIFSIWCSFNLEETPLPSIHRMPVAWTLQMPVPFRTPAEAFSAFHLSTNQLVEYLSGEWVGGGKDIKGFGPQGTTMPPPSTDICFEVQSSPTPCDSDIIALIHSSTGQDGYGSFSMEGTVSTEGEVWLTKLYAEELRKVKYSPQSPTFRFRGVITPFGISGVWEEDEGIHPTNGKPMRSRRGFFWLWKKEWTHEWPR